MKPPEIIITEDGSHSLRLPGTDEHYHSVHGAIAESMHVFIEAGLKKVMGSQTGPVNILEVGFGTGLNALLTLLAGKGKFGRINFTALEPFPLDKDTWQALNYPDLLEADDASRMFHALHEAPWGHFHEICPDFYLQKEQRGIGDYEAVRQKFHIVYFDAFGPDIQPELWTEEVFAALAAMTEKSAVLVTYSAKGSVRRALQKAGFAVERLPGPRGKREMLRGTRI